MCAQDIHFVEYIHSLYDFLLLVVQLGMSLLLEMFVLGDTDKFSDLFVSFIAEYILPLLVQLIELIEFEQEIGDVSDEADRRASCRERVLLIV